MPTRAIAVRARLIIDLPLNNSAGAGNRAEISAKDQRTSLRFAPSLSSFRKLLCAVRGDDLPRSRYVVQLFPLSPVLYLPRQLPTLIGKVQIRQAFAHCALPAPFALRLAENGSAGAGTVCGGLRSSLCATVWRAPGFRTIQIGPRTCRSFCGRLSVR